MIEFDMGNMKKCNALEKQTTYSLNEKNEVKWSGVEWSGVDWDEETDVDFSLVLSTFSSTQRQ
jgi:hypothetical protein